jgi:hypothetical protein
MRRPGGTENGATTTNTSSPLTYNGGPAVAVFIRGCNRGATSPLRHRVMDAGEA